MSDTPQKPLDPMPTEFDQWYWNGAEEGRFLGERCGSCQVFRNPPRPMCPHCHSLEKEHVELSGKGQVVSWARPVHPKSFGFDEPPIVALIDLEEGYRVLANLIDVDATEVRNDMAVRVDYLPTMKGRKLPVFRPVEEV